MPENRYKTTIEVGVDDREIRGLDQTLHRAFDPQLVASFERMLERTNRSMERMVKTSERMSATLRRIAGEAPPLPPSVRARRGGGGGAGGGGFGGAAGAAGGGGGGGTAGAALTSAISQLTQAVNRMGSQKQPGFLNRTLSTGFGTAMGMGMAGRAGNAAANVAAGAAQGEGVIQRAVAGVPYIGPFVGSALGGVQNYYQQHVQYQQQRAQAVGTLGRSSLPQGQFLRYGLDPGQAFGAAAPMAQAAGLSGADADADFFRTGLGLEKLGGVRTAPSVVRAAGVGRQSMGGMDFAPPGQTSSRLMLQAVSAGIETGVRKSRLGEFVQNAASILEQGRMKGINFELSQVLGLSRGLSGLGSEFGGERSMSAAQRIIPAMQNFTPSGDFRSLAMLMGGGFGRGEGGKSYSEARLALEKDPSGSFTRMQNQIRTMAGGDPKLAGEIWDMYFSQMAGSYSQAMALGRGDMSLEEVQREQSTDPARRFLGQRQRQVSGAFTLPAKEAAYRKKRIDIGGEQALQEVVAKLRGIELAMTQEILPVIADNIADMLGWMKKLYRTFAEEGVGAMLKQAAKDTIEGLGKAIEQGLESAFEDVFDIGMDEFKKKQGLEGPKNLFGGPMPGQDLDASAEGAVERQRQRERQRRGRPQEQPQEPPGENAVASIRRARDELDRAASALEAGTGFNENDLLPA